MVNVRFLFRDDSVIDCKNVISISNSRTEGTISGDQILSGYFPINANYYLKSDDESYSISCENLKSIYITKI